MGAARLVPLRAVALLFVAVAAAQQEFVVSNFTASFLCLPRHVKSSGQLYTLFSNCIICRTGAFDQFTKSHGD